jgi:energy-coupling factor transporter transmembrane protein EcfT
MTSYLINYTPEGFQSDIPIILKDKMGPDEYSEIINTSNEKTKPLFTPNKYILLFILISVIIVVLLTIAYILIMVFTKFYYVTIIFVILIVFSTLFLSGFLIYASRKRTQLIKFTKIEAQEYFFQLNKKLERRGIQFIYSLEGKIVI